MNKNIVALFGVILLMFVSSNVYAETNFSYDDIVNQTTEPDQFPISTIAPLQGSVIVVPAGTKIPCLLTAELSSSNTYLGQSISLILNTDYYYNNKLIAPSGSSIVGTVVENSKAKHGSMNGKLSVRFNNIYTPYGIQIPISAVIQTSDNSGVLVGGTKLDVTKEYAKDMAVGSAAGALSGVVFGALSGGEVGRGAALGTAVGAGGGIIKSIIDKGIDVSIPANSIIDIVLTQPITVSSNNYRYEN